MARKCAMCMRGRAAAWLAGPGVDEALYVCLKCFAAAEPEEEAEE